MSKLVLVMLVSVIAVFLLCVNKKLNKSPSLNSHPVTFNSTTTSLFIDEQHGKFSKVTLGITVNGKPDTVSDVFNISSRVNILFGNHDSNMTPNLGHTLGTTLKVGTHKGVTSYTHHSHSDKVDSIELINGCIYSFLVLFILWHISILILTFVFVSLDFCFNSTTKIQNNQKLHRHKTINFRFFEKFASKKLCVSDTIFFLLYNCDNHFTLCFGNLLLLQR